ncbi:MAG: energy-coupling factor transporter transmembrane component T [Candidatus Thermoplasmatota archaeon]
MKESFLKKLDPRSKLFFSFIVVVLAIIVPKMEYLIGLIIVTLLLVAFGKAIKKWLSYLSVFKILIPLLFFLNLFFYAQGKIFWSFEFSFLTLSITQGGLLTSVIILLRLFSIAATAALFVISTEPIELETALADLKFPWRLAFLFSLTLKLIPEMKTRYRKIKEAQLSRGLKMTGGPIEKTKKKVPMLIPFLASIIRYGYELTESLEARDFDDIGERTSLIELNYDLYDHLLYLLSISISSVYIYLNFL